MDGFLGWLSQQDLDQMALGQLDNSLVLLWIPDQQIRLRLSDGLFYRIGFGWFQDKWTFGLLQDNGFRYLFGLVRPWFFWLDIGFGSWT